MRHGRGYYKHKFNVPAVKLLARFPGFQSYISVSEKLKSCHLVWLHLMFMLASAPKVNHATTAEEFPHEVLGCVIQLPVTAR
jgi:hypothetical protein